MNKKDLVMTTVNRVPSLICTELTAGTVRIEGTDFIGSVDYHYNSGKTTINVIQEAGLEHPVEKLKGKQVSLTELLHCLSGKVLVNGQMTTVYALSIAKLFETPEPF